MYYQSYFLALALVPQHYFETPLGTAYLQHLVQHHHIEGPYILLLAFLIHGTGYLHF